MFGIQYQRLVPTRHEPGAIARLRTLSVIALTAAGYTAAAISEASAYKQAKIKHMSISPKTANGQVIYVTSTDGKKWNKIKSGSFQFWAQMKIDTKWPGYVSQVAVYLGKCNGAGCGASGHIYQDDGGERKYLKSKTFSFNPTSLMAAQIDGSAINTFGKHIIERCNQNMPADGPTKQRTFNQNVHVSLGATSGKSTLLDNIAFEASPLKAPTHIAHGVVPMPVVCQPVDPQPEVSEVQIPIKLTNLQLFLATYSNAVSNPSVGIECKKGKILIRASTNREGPVKLRLWTKVGGSPMTSELVNTWSNPNGGGKFQAEFEKWVSVDRHSVVKARVEDLVTKPFGLHDGWKDITLKCKTPGVGGLSQVPETAPAPNAPVPVINVLRPLLPKVLGRLPHVSPQPRQPAGGQQIRMPERSRSGTGRLMQNRRKGILPRLGQGVIFR